MRDMKAENQARYRAVKIASERLKARGIIDPALNPSTLSYDDICAYRDLLARETNLALAELHTVKTDNQSANRNDTEYRQSWADRAYA